MKACLGDLGCDATGFTLGGSQPLRFALCIRCKGTGFTNGKPNKPATIQMHSQKGLKAKIAKTTAHYGRPK